MGGGGDAPAGAWALAVSVRLTPKTTISINKMLFSGDGLRRSTLADLKALPGQNFSKRSRNIEVARRRTYFMGVFCIIKSESQAQIPPRLRQTRMGGFCPLALGFFLHPATRSI